MIYLIALLGIALVIADLWLFRSWLTQKNRIAELIEENGKANRNNETLRSTLSRQESKFNCEREKYREALLSRASGLGAGSLAELSRYLISLRRAIAAQIELLEQTTADARGTLDEARRQAVESRVIARKERFQNYYNALYQADINVGLLIEILSNDGSLVDLLIEKINAHRLDWSAGQIELEAIENVFQKLHDEAVSTLREEILIRNSRAEYENLLKFKDAWFAAGERIRKARPPNPNVARVARSLTDE